MDSVYRAKSYRAIHALLYPQSKLGEVHNIASWVMVVGIGGFTLAAMIEKHRL